MIRSRAHMQSPHYRDRGPGARNEALTAGVLHRLLQTHCFTLLPQPTPPALWEIKTHIDDIMFS